MVVSDEIAFVELNKTGSTHIMKLLMGVIEGERRGVHNAPSAALVESDRHFLGSIRNPWDWYVSLWAYGCQGDGALRDRLTTARLRGHGWRCDPAEALQSLWEDITRNHENWRQLYTDPADPALFREWLIRIHDEDIGPYTDSKVGELMGLLSRSYVRLFWHPNHIGRAVKSIGSIDEARYLDNELCYIDHFVRTEYLEDDLTTFLMDVCNLGPNNEVARNYEQTKTNSSSRKRDTGYYYDRTTRDLVRRKDALVIGKFGYKEPAL